MSILKIGDKFENFKFNTPFESNLDFEQEVKNKKTFVVFLRYYGCTLCQLDLLEYRKNLERFKQADINLYIVLQSDPEVISSQVSKTEMPLNIICDPQQVLYKKYQIKPAKTKLQLVSAKALKKIQKAKKLNLEHGKYEGEELQLPAMFMIKDGIVSFAHYAKNLTDLPSIDEMLEM
ncbi:MAG: redoxin domain-containing protein [Erysipelotrichaceae bacterium]